jgi:ABC-type dipeptide/oligopeptide/nickel transport system permease subunit
MAAPLLAVCPGLMIFLTVVACLLGDALQRRLDLVTGRAR